MTILEITGLSKHYGEGDQRTDVLSNINLKVEEGEFIVIVGFSGSGKTTLISALAGLIEPDAGGVLFRDKYITKLFNKIRDKLGAKLQQENEIFLCPYCQRNYVNIIQKDSLTICFFIN